jgi:hypothetical protein
MDLTTRFGVGALALFLFAVVLTVNGAVPGVLSPTFGQALWTLGFAKSFASAPIVSIFATNIGAPTPAAIAFGLSAALPTALLLKIGMLSANAYASVFAIWLAVAFWGGFRLARTMGASDAIALLCSAIWLTTPIVWAHQDYSMLALGMALLPFYVYAAWRIIWNSDITVTGVLFFLAACIVSVFMDGYTFMLYASACAGLYFVAFLTIRDKKTSGKLIRFLVLTIGFLISYLLYSLYVGGSHFPTEPLDFFRAWGANIEFLLVPTSGVSMLADVLRLSSARDSAFYFGDGSVFLTTFSLGLMIAAIIGLVVGSGNWRWKLAFFLVAIAGFYMSLGPSFKFLVMKPAGAGQLMPEEFAPIATGTGFLSSNLPGLNSMRASYRWVGLGAFAAWAVFAASFSGRQRLVGWQGAMLVALIAFNIPPIGRITSYMQSRDNLLEVDQMVRDAQSQFTPMEKVAFVPRGNDFLLTYLAPNLNIVTFNIGGDKNIAQAARLWPKQLLRFTPVQPGHIIERDFAAKVEALLESDAADAVALSYVDNWEPSQHWPVAPIFKDTLTRVAARLKANPRLDLDTDQHFIVVRLKDGLTGLGDTYLQPFDVPLIIPKDQLLTITAQKKLGKFFRGRGWSALEDFGIWSMNKDSTLMIHPFGVANGNSLTMTLNFVPYIPRPTDEMTVNVLVNGKLLLTKKYVGPAAAVAEQVTFARDLLDSNGNATIEFKIDPLLSPADLGEGDSRKLGVKLYGISLN